MLLIHVLHKIKYPDTAIIYAFYCHERVGNMTFNGLIFTDVSSATEFVLHFNLCLNDAKHKLEMYFGYYEFFKIQKHTKLLNQNIKLKYYPSPKYYPTNKILH